MSIFSQTNEITYILNSNKEGIIIVGAGGHGKSMTSLLMADGKKVIGILDDEPSTWQTRILGVPVLGPLDLLLEYSDHSVLNALGDNKSRKSVVDRFPGSNWIGFKSPLAYIHPSARIGEGTVILTFAIIAADVVLEDHVIVSTHTTVGHDTHIHDFAHVAPGTQIAGGVQIGNTAMLGMGSVVCPGVRIGDDTIVAAGAVVVNDIDSGVSVFGTPAKPKM